jgi:arsenite methyltransferase
MTSMSYEGDVGRIQRALAMSDDIARRRSAVIEALHLRSGEKVVEVGCGGGSYAREVGVRVGPDGRVRALDVSGDQIAAAKARCADLPWVECTVGDVRALPFEDGEFDAAFAVQVLEYIPELDRALEELKRMLCVGGRLLVFATNWSSLVWHSAEPERMRQVLRAWNGHAPFPDLPTILPYRMKQVGLSVLEQLPIPVLNTSYDETSFSYLMARLIRSFLAGRQGIPPVALDSWLSEFDDLHARSAYFFCSTPVITQGKKLQ